MQEAKSEFDRIKELKDELDAKVAKLELDVEKEKSRAVAAEAATNLAEEMAKKPKESYTRTYGELLETRERLESAQADYTELQGYFVGSVTDAYENLKAQIVPALDENEEEGPPPMPPVKAPATTTSSTPSAEVGHPESDPDVQILNREDGTVDATPLKTIPPSTTQSTAAEETLNPL
nr:membrane-associated 30 kDa protein, chloroplastic-like [Arachis hypogaea]